MSEAAYFRRVEGPNVYLSPINPEDYARYTLWLNDPDIATSLGLENVPGLAREKEFLEKMTREPHNFAIVRQRDDTLLGNCSLMNVEHKHQKAVCGLFIGPQENLGRGYGSEALALLCAYGFDELNLHNIMLNVFGFNARAIRAYEKVGFQRIGVRRASHYTRGALQDEILMDLLPSELNRDLIRRG